MILRLIISCFLVFSLCALKVQWESEEYQAIQLEQAVESEFVEQCLQSGLRVEHRFYIQLCRRRVAWFDTCGPVRKQIQTLTKDQISQRYKINKDLLGDQYDPEVETTSSFESALESIQHVPPIDVTFLDASRARRLTSSRTYISARAITRCDGAYSDALRRVAYVLTLSLIDLDGADTGWIDFELAWDS